jgi:hypothetical protein
MPIMGTEILLANIERQGYQIEGTEYVPIRIDDQPLNAGVLDSIREVQKQTSIGSYKDITEVTMPVGWTPTSVGGDNQKLIAVNPEGGVAIKRYKNKEFAWVVFEGYRLLGRHLDLSKFPVLIPIARYGDTLIFPYFDIQPDPQDVRENAWELAQAAEALPLPNNLFIAGKLKKFVLKNGGVRYSVIFDDSSPALEYVLDSLGRIKEYT